MAMQMMLCSVTSYVKADLNATLSKSQCGYRSFLTVSPHEQSCWNFSETFELFSWFVQLYSKPLDCHRNFHRRVAFFSVVEIESRCFCYTTDVGWNFGGAFQDF